MPAPGDRALVHADVEAVRPGGGAQRGHRLLGELGQLGGLRPVQVRVVGDMPVGDDHQVAAVVRVQVEHRVDVLAARDDQPVLVGLGRDRAEGTAVVGTRAGRLVLALDVGHPVGRPQALERVLRPHSDLLLRLTRHAVQHMASPVRGVSPGLTPTGRPAMLSRWTTTAGLRRWEQRTELSALRRLTALPHLVRGPGPGPGPLARSGDELWPGGDRAALGASSSSTTWCGWRLSGRAAALRAHALAGHRGTCVLPLLRPLRHRASCTSAMQRRAGTSPGSACTRG